MASITGEALDVWFRFNHDDYGEGLAEYEANVFADSRGGYVVAWYHNDVGLVTYEEFPTYGAARQWLLDAGFEDFTAF